MMPSRCSRPGTLSAIALGLIAVSGCASWNPEQGSVAAPLAGTLAANETPYSESLRCLRRYTATRPVRVVVGPIADRESTNDAVLMTVAALAKAGVPLAKHFGIAVAMAEPRRGGYTILARAVPGSDFYLAGAVTGLQVETESHARLYRIRLGLDLRLMDIDTQQLVDVISYQRQMSGSGTREPVRAAVRSAIERAVLEMVSRLYRVPDDACASQLGGPSDPLASPGDPPPVGSVALNEYARQTGGS
jgi:curli production assembly/transport component CsgG/holdfast attachment protein HfaB